LDRLAEIRAVHQVAPQQILRAEAQISELRPPVDLIHFFSAFEVEFLKVLLEFLPNGQRLR
jgi:hypothetical protein